MDASQQDNSKESNESKDPKTLPNTPDPAAEPPIPVPQPSPFRSLTKIAAMRAPETATATSQEPEPAASTTPAEAHASVSGVDNAAIPTPTFTTIAPTTKQAAAPNVPPATTFQAAPTFQAPAPELLSPPPVTPMREAPPVTFVQEAQPEPTPEKPPQPYQPPFQPPPIPVPPPSPFAVLSAPLHAPAASTTTEPVEQTLTSMSEQPSMPTPTYAPVPPVFAPTSDLSPAQAEITAVTPPAPSLTPPPAPTPQPHPQTPPMVQMPLPASPPSPPPPAPPTAPGAAYVPAPADARQVSTAPILPTSQVAAQANPKSKSKKPAFTRTLHEFAALGSSGLLYSDKPNEFTPTSAAPEVPEISIYQSIDNALEARAMPDAYSGIEPAVENIAPARAPGYPTDHDAAYAAPHSMAAHDTSHLQNAQPMPELPRQTSSNLESIAAGSPPAPNLTGSHAAMQQNEPKIPRGLNLASSITAINRAKEIKRVTALSQALERDKAWLEGKNEPSQRDVLDAQLLASHATEVAPEPKPHQEPAQISRTAFSSTIDKTTVKNLPKPSLFQKGFEYAIAHPLPIGIGCAALLVVFGFVQLQALQATSQQVQSGATLLAHGDPRAAITVLNKAIANNSSYVDAYLVRGKAFARLDDTERALDSYQKALKLEPKNAEALSQSAFINLGVDNYKAAIAFFQDYLKQYGTTKEASEARVGLAQAYIGSHQYDLALEQLNKAVDASPTDASIRLERAICYQRMESPVEAILDCTAAIKLNAKLHNAYLLRARSYQMADDRKKALLDYDKAISLEPKNPAAFVARGAFYTSQKEFDQAQVDFAKAIALAPKSPQAYEQRAKLYISQGDKEKAEKDYDIITALPGFKANYAYNAGRADIYLQSGNFQKALAFLQKAQSKDSAHSDDYSLLIAECQAGLKQYSKAAFESAKVVASQPSNSVAVMKHGQYSYLAGNKITGQADLFKAIALNPKNADAFVQRGNYYFAEKQFGSASEDYARALKLNPKLTAASEKLAICQAQVKQVKGIRRDDSEKVATLSPAELREIADASPTTLQQKGYEALRAGKVQYAMMALTRAVQSNPNSQTARRYLAQAMISTGDGNGAVQQFYTWEKLGNVSANDEITFARALIDAGDTLNGQTILDHIIAKFSTDSAVLLNIAHICSAMHYQTQLATAIAAGLKTGSAAERAQFEKMQASLSNSQ